MLVRVFENFIFFLFENIYLRVYEKNYKIIIKRIY
jgi:hypothetical protein